MRKHQQKQILKLIQTINQAQSAGLYADCQEGAVSIGTFIESIEGEGTETVALLEEYCELLFKASKGEIKEKVLRKHMIKIENSVNDELKANKTEIVFLPYKVSMWDSLESIYLAAKADPNCNAYVVPIPSYELNSNGTLGEMYYDGDQYPRDTPIVDWQAYDIEARHPDVIFIHYAYDDNVNNATTHPAFYSKRLREHCELLVYVPYFVTTADTVDDYCSYLPGVLYAHHVIVQSEAVRQSYIGHYKRFDKEFGWKGRFGKAEEKFLALGSPKFDKVINTKREDCELPAEWARLIYKPDGSRKKVILYNTHMFTWINLGEAYFKKLHSVFDYFRKCDDVVLWWRPHPNTEMNIKVKRPEWFGEYKSIVEGYKNGGWGIYGDPHGYGNMEEGEICNLLCDENTRLGDTGEERKPAPFIYDDSPDLHRAISWADAYYGDLSSLVSLFGITGKPIVIQDVNSTEKDVLLRFADFAFDDEGNAWAFELFNDGLFKLDFENNTAELMAKSGCTPKYKGNPTQVHRYISIHCLRDEVICFPYFLHNIFIYDRKTGESKQIPLNREYMLDNDYDGFALRYTVEHQGKIYAFGLFSEFPKAIVVFDSKSGSVSYDTDLFKRVLSTNNKTNAKFPIYVSGCSEDGIVTLMVKNCEHLIRYNISTQEFEFIASNSFLSMCIRADFDGQDYWLISEKNDKLIKWSPNSNEYTEYYMSKDGFTFSHENIFSGLSDCGEYLLLYPLFGDIVLSFNKKTEHFNEYTVIPILTNNRNKVFKYDLPKHFGEEIYALSRFNATIYELNKSTGAVKPHSFKLKGEYYASYFDNCFDGCSHLSDLGLGDIAKFFDYSLNFGTVPYSKRQKIFLENSANKDGTAGEIIYKFVK